MTVWAVGWPVVEATATGLASCLLGWGAWRHACREGVGRRRERLRRERLRASAEGARAGPEGAAWRGGTGEGAATASRLPLQTGGLTGLRRGGEWASAWVRAARGSDAWAVAVLGAAAGAAAGAVSGSWVPVLLAGVLVRPVVRARRRRRERVRRAERRSGVAQLCAALAGELRAGATPHQAVEMACAEPSGSGPGSGLDRAGLLAAVRFGGGVPEALAALAALPGGEGAAAVAACWQVAAASGSGLARGLDRVAEGLRAEVELEESLRAELAGPRSTALLLAVLPGFGLLLGSALGARPWVFLLHGTPGLACLGGGLALEGAGLRWTAWLVERAERDGAAVAGPARRGGARIVGSSETLRDNGADCQRS